MPGVWGNIMTFSDGNHACIGWRFALVEYVQLSLPRLCSGETKWNLNRMKALLFTLIRAYEFQLAVPKEDVLMKRAFPVIHPVVRNASNDGSSYKLNCGSLPMVIRALD